MTQVKPMTTPKVSSTAFDLRVSSQGAPGLMSAPTLGVIQVNVGLKCNLTCTHCHVNSSPKRTEEMGWNTMEAVLDLARRAKVRTVDITGGAPEMNPHFQRFIIALHGEGIETIVRTNLTILDEPGYEDFPEF
ncbi:MAG: radical SAM protein, partial [Proteobacteria bacterium]|nr:radical SAM protein [Pseudomonadota bacterium]